LSSPLRDFIIRKDSERKASYLITLISGQSVEVEDRLQALRSVHVMLSQGKGETCVRSDLSDRMGEKNAHFVHRLDAEWLSLRNNDLFARFLINNGFLRFSIRSEVKVGSFGLDTGLLGSSLDR
jgi:hypothetical protein